MRFFHTYLPSCLGVAVLLALTAAAAALTATAAAAQSAAGPEAAKAAKKLYKQNCEECHGATGRGDGAKARSMGFHPRDFGLGAFKCRCTPSGALPSDEDLRRTIRGGLPGSPMVGLPDASSEDIDLLVAFVKSLTPGFAAEAAPPCLDLPPPPASGSIHADEGAQLYRILGCWNCHGAEGAGDGPASSSLLDPWQDRIRVPNFVRSPKFKCGIAPTDIYRTLHTGMSGTPMPSFVAALGFAREDVGKLAALEAAFGTDGARAAREYLEKQPGRDRLASLPMSERADLVARRTWALVDYLLSLIARR